MVRNCLLLKFLNWSAVTHCYKDIKKMMGCFSSGLMSDPFTHDWDALLNIATVVVLPEDVAQEPSLQYRERPAANECLRQEAH